MLLASLEGSCALIIYLFSPSPILAGVLGLRWLTHTTSRQAQRGKPMLRRKDLLFCRLNTPSSALLPLTLLRCSSLRPAVTLLGDAHAPRLPQKGQRNKQPLKVQPLSLVPLL